MSDLISRQAAVEALTKTSGIRGDTLKALYDLPSVNPRPKTGHWIFDDECKEHGHCSRCGYGSVDLVDGESHNFCRNCGARMVESQERSDKE